MPLRPSRPGGPLRPGRPLAPECPGNPFCPEDPGGPGGPGGPWIPEMPDSGLVRLAASWASCSVAHRKTSTFTLRAPALLHQRHGDKTMIVIWRSWLPLPSRLEDQNPLPCITLLQTCLMWESVGTFPWGERKHNQPGWFLLRYLGLHERHYMKLQSLPVWLIWGLMVCLSVCTHLPSGVGPTRPDWALSRY